MIPRNVLVAMSDLFPEEIPYSVRYKRGETHPAYWPMVPEADHVFAHSRGGANVLENLTTLHAACNTQKSDSLMESLPELKLAVDDRKWDRLSGGADRCHRTLSGGLITGIRGIHGFPDSLSGPRSRALALVASLLLTALSEIPHFCSSKFPTLGRSAA